MTQYLLSVHHTPDDAMLKLSPEEAQPYFDATGVFNELLRTAGVWVFAGGLHPVE